MTCFLKKIIEIEENVEDINIDLHHVKPEYLKKLEAIRKEGRFQAQNLKRSLV